MKMAFIIMAYKDPKQIERLVRRMHHKSFHFYIHVDKKIDIKPFEYLRELEGVFFTKTRKRIEWAGYSFTKTLILCTKEILEISESYDFITSFSGQDYPIKSNEFLVDYFSSNMGKSFFSLEPFPSPWWKESEHRYLKYHMTDFTFKGRYVIQSMSRILPDRDFSFFEQLYGGPRATWWTMSAKCANYVVDYFLKHKRLRRYIKFCWAPDEYLIPSIVMNSDYADSVINDSGRYIDWSEGGANPKILTKSDYEPLIGSSKLFARKFDIKVDTEILDMLDKVYQIESSTA